MMADVSRVVHACWSGGTLHLWAEDSERAALAVATQANADTPLDHAFAVPSAQFAELLPATVPGTPAELVIRLPVVQGIPTASPRLSGRSAAPAASSVEMWRLHVPTVAFTGAQALVVLEALIDDAADASANRDQRLSDPSTDSGSALAIAEKPALQLADSVHFFAAAARLAQHLIAQQRFVPMLRQQASGELHGAWQPWTSDEATAQRLGLLVRAMPPEARAVVDEFGHSAAAIVEDFLTALVDAHCRQFFLAEDLMDAVRERDPVADPHVAWLTGLLGAEDAIAATPAVRQEMVRRVRGWIGGLEERGASAAWRLCLRLNEPVESSLLDTDVAIAALPGKASKPVKPMPDPVWTLSFHLQAVDRPTLMLDAPDIWLLPSHSVTVEGRRVESPQELLLGELGRASKLYKKLESALDDAAPAKLELNTKQAYEFLREVRPILQEQGFGVQAPTWWESPAARLGARLRLDGVDGTEGLLPGAAASSATSPQLGLGALVRYRWEIAVGDVSLSLQEFEQLASRQSPLVRINGRWVEVRPEDVQAAIKFMRENPGGTMKMGEALRMAYASDLKQTGIPVVGLEATGWLESLLGSDGAAKLELLDTPKTFLGTLRPYQARGMSWLEFLERIGLGACLADDMGLGKTIQLLALLAREREVAAAQAEKVGGLGNSAPRVLPTLLIVPMSVVGNWIHETRRFCPHLKVVVHHGMDRKHGEKLIEAANAGDLIITTYALAHRDRDVLQQIQWGRLVLDEAQYIKNPSTKQTQAVRSINAERRIALTGTPVENRLSELWSIIDFLNPGYLGSVQNFRQRFGIPIERYRDKNRAEQLRGLIRPFVLRRLKTDPTVVPDLPEKIEGREYCHLTSEQASLYESCVRRMLGEVEQAEGIHRRGLVLSALIKLKQICNHPAQMLKENEGQDLLPGSRVIDPSRSGKCVRILEMLDEVMAEGDQAIVFTQFRQMGALLAPMIRHRFGKEVLFLHGGTSQAQRQQMIDQFQRADGNHPVLLLSLRAGGVGLNLTAATHVFHFDRWWNPAVENQATDRAFRIGQTRTVQVHKFVVRGTLEERIDEMIEQKTELATNIIGSGERWLTELNTDQLRDILTLRADAVGDEA